MTAVEAAPPATDGRREREAAGRHCRRILRMSADERARNDLPPRRTVAEAMGAPDGAIRAGMVASAADLWARGAGARQRRSAVERLVALGALDPVALRPTDPVGRMVAESIRRPVGAAGFAALIDDVGQAAAPDLVSCAKSQPTPRGHGFRGLTAAGRRAVRDASALMAEHKGCIGFATLTLTDREAEAATREQLARFQSAWMQFARRALIAAGLPPLVVLVAEIHPSRRTMAGGPVVHWHAAYVGKAQATDGWALGKAAWHRVTRWAWSSAFGYPRPHTYGCRFEKARKDPGRYLSKYLSKGRSNCERWRGTEWERCIPRQWWAWTGELRDLTKGARIRPPSAFLRWCCRWRADLQALGECVSGEITLEGSGARIGVWFGWQSEAALDRAIDGWIMDGMRQMDARDLGTGPAEYGP